jgi:LPXTG-motif cell wall-anchored protein
MGKHKKPLVIVLQSILIFLSVNFSVYASNTDELVIKTIPNKELFTILNMAPGDIEMRILTVQNRDSRNFTYNSKARLRSGSEQFYNQLLLKIEDSNEILFNGRLKEYEGIPTRLLRSLHQEDLKFSIEFPIDSGNEYKGLKIEVEFIFTAIIENNNEIPEDPKDPENPVDPEDPTDPEDPEDPKDPENPVDPTDPENPENPEDPTDPENPVDPEDPKDPENPVDPEDPTDPENPVDPEDPEGPENPVGPEDPVDPDDTPIEEVKPERPINEDDLGSDPVEGQILPSTSTNIYNFLILGFVLLLAGIGLNLYRKKQRKYLETQRS